MARIVFSQVRRLHQLSFNWKTAWTHIPIHSLHAQIHRYRQTQGNKHNKQTSSILWYDIPQTKSQSEKKHVLVSDPPVEASWSNGSKYSMYSHNQTHIYLNTYSTLSQAIQARWMLPLSPQALPKQKNTGRWVQLETQGINLEGFYLGQ